MAATGYGALDKLTLVQYTSGAWPARPSSATVVCWVGPSAPGIGGSGATGRDFWVQTAT